MAKLSEKNFRIPQDVKDIHVEKGVKEGEAPKVDGYNLKKIFEEYTAIHKVVPYGENRMNSLEIRARGVNINESSLERIVKSTLGNKLTADNKTASKMIVALFAEGIKTEGFQFHKDDPITKEVKKYLLGTDKDIKEFSDLSEKTRDAISRFYAHAASATGDSTIGDVFALKQAIINMPVAKPGDPAYDKNSVLAKLISYIAGQTDNPIARHKNNTPRRVNYLQEQLAQLARHPRYGLELIRMFNTVLPKETQLSTSASLQQMLSAYQANVGTKVVQYNTGHDTTYTLPKAA